MYGLDTIRSLNKTRLQEDTEVKKLKKKIARQGKIIRLLVDELELIQEDCREAINKTWFPDREGFQAILDGINEAIKQAK